MLKSKLVVLMILISFIFSACATALQSPEIKTYDRELISTEITSENNMIYTFSESAVTRRGYTIVASDPPMFTSFFCPQNGPSIEIMYSNGSVSDENECRILRSFNQGSVDISFPDFEDDENNSNSGKTVAAVVAVFVLVAGTVAISTSLSNGNH